MKKHIPGMLLSLVLALTLGFLDFEIYHTQFFPTKLFILVTVLFVLIWILLTVMVFNTKRIVLFIFGVVLSLLFTAGAGYGSYMLQTAMSTVNNILDSRVESVQMNVYVRNDDPAVAISDASNYLFGVLSQGDAASTEKAITEVESSTNTILSIRYYDRTIDLADALLGGECDAIIVNPPLLELVSETSGYEDFMSRIRELSSVKVEHVIQEKPILKPQIQASEPVGDDLPCFAVYLSGIDTYGDVSARSRSDVNIIAFVNPTTHQVLLLSTPRDYYVSLPRFDYAKDKLTHAGIYGVECSMETLANLYDTEINYYFRVNFSGFENIIDALGGISVYSSQEFVSLHGNDYFQVGYNDVNGAQALGFARERYSFSDGDNQRGRNQVEVIKATIKKMLSPAFLTNYTQIMQALEGSFTTSVPYDVISKLVKDQLDTSASWDIVSCNVSGWGNSCQTYSSSEYLYVMMPYEEDVAHAIDLITQLYNNEIISND